MGDRPLTEDEQKKLADLKGLRLIFRKDARSGNPAKRDEALKRLWAVEQMIQGVGK